MHECSDLNPQSRAAFMGEEKWPGKTSIIILCLFNAYGQYLGSLGAVEWLRWNAG